MQQKTSIMQRKSICNIGCIIILNIIILLSCQNNSNDINKDDINKKNKTDTTSRYPEGVIPEWVKDSLSAENYELLKKISAKYKIRYYLLEEKRDFKFFTRACYQHLNTLLINATLDSTIVQKPAKTDIFTKIEVLSNGKSGDINQEYDYASTIVDAQSINYLAGRITVKAYLTWQKNISTRDFKDITLRVNIASTGITCRSNRWIDNGSIADKQGNDIRCVIIGTAEIFTELDNVGLILSHDVNRIFTIDPFNCISNLHDKST